MFKENKTTQQIMTHQAPAKNSSDGFNSRSFINNRN